MSLTRCNSKLDLLQLFLNGKYISIELDFFTFMKFLQHKPACCIEISRYTVRRREVAFSYDGTDDVELTLQKVAKSTLLTLENSKNSDSNSSL